ncbi:unnamed protein product [Rotaria sordida]|uniref:VWFA domain-containing protein n=1 Tax=Rotaria sordida TaxID=392033 RepID=A0A815G8J7_9BILA|nr:unnamed protein product [Rotaria sordida]CAF1335325.1 unnamed protein product [Rotaria sordida]CAF3835227.1 unnamed protein product [Rotaria sordida]CAF4018582.1 unnamed protein product [Rotaria sordida]
MNADQKKKVKSNLNSFQAGDGTDMSAGVRTNSNLFSRIQRTKDYENRIIFFTDAQINTDEMNVEFFKSILVKHAGQYIFIIFIGIIIDLQISLIQDIANTRGANYFTVNNEKFFKLLDDNFDLIVAPLIFNFQLHLQSNQFQIEDVFGSPKYADSTIELLKINILVPARIQNEDKNQDTSTQIHYLQLTITYEDRLGNVTEPISPVNILNQISQSTNNDKYSSDSFYSNNNIHKAILLVEYVTLLTIWIQKERDYFYDEKKTIRIKN